MRKGISVILVAALVLAAGFPAFAESSDSEGLAKAISAAKKVITIPEEYKVFDYNIQEEGKSGGKTYRLSWQSEDGEKNISVMVNSQNQIQDYDKYDGDRSHEGLGSVTKEAAEKTAQGFLEKALPDMASKMKMTKSISRTGYQEVDYTLYQNDIEVSFMDVAVNVDKFSGEVTSYRRSNETMVTLPAKEKLIGKESANKAFLSHKMLELKYYSHYDYQKKQLNVFAAYGTVGNEKGIDAQTEEIVTFYRNYDALGKGGTSNAKEEQASDNLSREELEAVDNAAALLSKEKAEILCRSLAPNITSDMKATSYNLYKDSINKDQYIWNISFDNAHARIDAESGNLISFYLYNDEDSKANPSINADAARVKAEAYIKGLAGTAEKFTQTRDISEIGKEEDQSRNYRFTYERMVDGIPFADNTISVDVNKANGKIVSYDCNWYNKAQFPAVSQAMTEEKAFEILASDGEFDLSYVKTDEEKAALVYRFKNPINYMIDPVKGTKINWDGKAYRKTETPSYTDIQGHWCENTIMALLENGYYISGEQFKPNSKITQERFLRYLYSQEQSGYDQEEFYKMLENQGLVKSGEKAPAAELKRQDAAKFAVRYLGQGKSAEHPEIFKSPFKDAVQSEYLGYAAICYGLDVMKGDTKGRFNGGTSVSNAEAAMIIYNVLKVL